MKDGTFVTVRIPTGKRPLVGKEYQASYFFNRKRSLFVLPSLSLSVAALLAFVFLSGLIPLGNQSAAAAYVSFDMNPSIEVGVNEEMEVVEIDAFNDEAQKIIKKYNLSVDKHLTFEEFADKLINAYEEEGYMKSDQSMLITTVSSEEGNKETEAALNNAVDSIVKKTVVKYPVAITVSETNTDTRSKAKHLGVSSGKYTAFQKANKAGKPIKEEKIKGASIQELKMDKISASKDIKVVPHPRKINSSPHEIKIDSSAASSKKVKEGKKEHDHRKHHHNALEKADKPSKQLKVKNVSSNVKNIVTVSNNEKKNAVRKEVKHQEHQKKNKQSHNKIIKNPKQMNKKEHKH